MSSSFIASVNFARKEIGIYFVIPLFIMSIIGGCLNVIIFLSLKTFRQSSCAFYLMIMSIYDVARTFSNVLPFSMRWGFGIDWGLSSYFFCKIRNAMETVFTLSSLTCLCLAVIDQYFATCSNVRWQQWCNIKLAHRLTAIFMIFWILHGIPFVIFYDYIISSSTNTTTCDITNDKFRDYHVYGYYFTLSNLLPFIAAIFGLMAYHNARNLAHRTTPLVRRELDKQLTVMVLVQVLVSFCTLLPYSITNIFSTITATQSDPVFRAKSIVAQFVTLNFSILSRSSPFYTYVCVSKRFRQQMKHVLFDVPIKQCQRNRIVPNEIALDIPTNI